MENLNSKKKTMDMIIIGFALFSTFFGAGNLIFPPYLGAELGSHWVLGYIGFMIGDAVFAIAAVIASCKFSGNNGIMTRTGKRFSVAMGSIIILCLGPLLAIPRTGAVTYEISFQPLFPSISPIIVSVIFFAVTLVLAIRPSKVVDYIGKFLTPALLIALAILIIKGIITPLGKIRPDSLVPNYFQEGLLQGYQTMDALGGTIMAILVTTAIVNKGYTSTQEKVSMATKSGIVAGVALCFVYGGLCFLGATTSTGFDPKTTQTALLVFINGAVLGNVGKVILAIIVALACLTTSTGLSSSAAQFFANATKGKLKYEWVVTAICVFSCVVSVAGVSRIIAFSGPILGVLYPVVVSMIALSLFTGHIRNDNIFKAASYTALVVSVLMTVLPMMNVTFLNKLPFTNFGFGWVVPVVIAAVIGKFIPMHGVSLADSADLDK